MCYQEKDDEYYHYRDLYIDAVSRAQFPWDAAYYYYMQNIDRIDVMSRDAFQDDLLTIHGLCDDEEDAYDKVSAPIYAALDNYFNIATLISKTNEVVKLV